MAPIAIGPWMPRAVAGRGPDAASERSCRHDSAFARANRAHQIGLEPYLPVLGLDRYFVTAASREPSP